MRTPRFAVVLAALLASACIPPDQALELDKFSMVFTRVALVTPGDDLDPPGPRYTPGEEVQKRVVLSNPRATPVNLEIFLVTDDPDYPHADAYRVRTPEATDLPSPFNYRVEGYSRLQLDVAFLGITVGPNLARLGVRNVDEDYAVSVILQGVVDCVSLGWDLDGDGFCQNVSGIPASQAGEVLQEDCNDDPDGGYGVNPGAQESCEVGDQVDNNCDDSVLLITDRDADGHCDAALSCAADVATLDAACRAPDCDDSDPDINPSNPEVCEPGGTESQIDNDCDPSNDITAMALFLPDGDADGWGWYDPSLPDGDPRAPRLICGQPPVGFVACVSDGSGGCRGDCDDLRASVFPGAQEVCDGFDTDCDPSTPLAGDVDDDGDGIAACETSPLTGLPLDCDDGNQFRYRGAPELCDTIDNDCNGAVPAREADNDGDLYVQCTLEPAVINFHLLPPPLVGGGDCNDNNAAVNPDQVEQDCDEVDNNCDGVVLPTEFDDDFDGFTECDGDCNDLAPTVFQGADELCDGQDNDCDGEGLDEERDDDGDGWVECFEEANPPVGYVGIVGFTGGGDCNDDPNDPVASSVYPNAPEVSDSYWDLSDPLAPVFREVDNQCPGDAGFGLLCTDFTVSLAADCSDPTVPCWSCTGSEYDDDLDGVTEAQGDCDDGDEMRSPLLTEVCDGVDNNCDGFVPLPEQDGDGDGFVVCDPIASAIHLQGGDCDDGDDSVNPGEPETANGLDDNCDGVQDDEETDLDGDGVSELEGDCDDLDPLVSPTAPERCNGFDDDCNGLADYDDPVLGGELDQDGDGYTPCGDGDCLDSAAQLGAEFQAATGQPYPGTNGLAVAVRVHPGAIELCDGWANDCGASGSLAYIPISLDGGYADEYDNDGDGYIECAAQGAVGWAPLDASANLAVSGGNDCADTAADILGINGPQDEIHPGAPETCDGWDNDCTGGSPFTSPLSDEYDDDGDRFLECGAFAPNQGRNPAGQVLLGGDDCLDQETTHFATGQLMGLNIAASVRPGAAETCDGLNSDCSAPLQAVGYDAEQLDENDADDDLFLECDSPVPTLVPGYGVGDCLDEPTPHFRTGQTLTLAIAGQVNPGVAEVCDGLNTDCSTPFAAAADYQAEAQDEDDEDADSSIECAVGASTLVPGYTPGDCLDEATFNPKTGLTMTPAAVGFHVHPGAAEACDGLNTDCGPTGTADAWDTDDDSEDDQDADGYLECSGPATWIVSVGFEVGDCLDEATVHHETGILMTAEGVGAFVHPNTAEACDGLNTNCSLPLDPTFKYDAEDGPEDDQDVDGYLECTTPAAWIAEVGKQTGDCLDEITNHFRTGEALTLAIGAQVHPGAVEVCDGLNTDCSTPLSTVTPYHAEGADEDDHDADSSIECDAGAPSLVPGYTVGDCLDEDTFNPKTGLTMTAAQVGFRVHPGAAEACDGLNTDCGPTGTAEDWDTDDDSEDDQDGDGYLECSGPASWIGAVGFAVGDCLDEATVHHETGNTMEPLEVGLHVHPGAAEVCDGLNTDCSTPVNPANGYDAEGGDEDDEDVDGYLECTTPAPWLAFVGKGTGDCLDEQTTHFQTGAVMTPLGVGRHVHPGAAEACDGLNTDCSLPLESIPYDAEQSDENDVDQDGYLECTSSVSWRPQVGKEIGDCLDEPITHPATSQAVPVATAALVNPGATEVCDGLNTDCSTPLGSPSWAPDLSSEQDNDGDLHLACGVDTVTRVPGLSIADCNDFDDGVNPIQNDDFSDNLVDNDCDGYVDEDGIVPGTVAITEVLAAPNNREFFELRNNAPGSLNLRGWRFRDTTSFLAISADTIVGPGEYFVFCGDVSAIPGVTCINGTDLPFDIGLNSDTLTVQSPEQIVTVDDFSWSTAVGATNVSLGLDPALLSNPLQMATANNNRANWCNAVSPWPGGGGAKGTPGFDNPSCDSDQQDNDLDGFCETGIDGNGDGDCDDVGESQADAVLLGACTGAVCDCLDSNGEVNPSAPEVCDGWDTDCTQDTDTGAPEDSDEDDGDGDGYIECGPYTDHGNGALIGGEDCDDLEITTFPGATEFCDAVDSDCNTSIVDGFADFDNDADPDCNDTDDDEDGDPDVSDCAPFNDAIYAGAPEVCDLIDSDCDTTLADEFPDLDGDDIPDCVDTDIDGDGDPNSTDCNTTDDTVYTGAPENCDSIDSDCDGGIVDGFPNNDGDSQPDCVDPDDDNDGTVDVGDCDPFDDTIFPGASESCDLIDSDCDTSLVDSFTNTDGDSLPDCVDPDDDGDGDPDSTDCADLNPARYNGAPELCDNIDSDCDGSLADEFADADGDDIPDCVDTDTDGDGIDDGFDACPIGEVGWTSSGTTDHDGDGCRDAGEDLDDDDDTIVDTADVCPTGNLFTSNNLSDHDGDGCEDDSAEDLDDDDDGVADGVDSCPVGALFTSSPSSDHDGDGCRDSGEDTDDDDDGVSDGADDCPAGDLFVSSASTDHDSDGCQDSGEDTDDDNDGIADGPDSCPVGALFTSSPSSDHDGDGCQDSGEDTDDDDDGVADGSDACPAGALFTSGPGTDHDGDGCRDSDEDGDDDGDGIGDGGDSCPTGALFASNAGTDHDADGCRDTTEDTDDDNDGIADGSDSCSVGALFNSNGGTDHDGDGCRDADEDADDDNDGVDDGPDDCSVGALFTSNGTTDHDGDGCRDSDEDTDDDDDTVADGSDSCPTGALFTSTGATDHDGDGCRDSDEDPDDDDDGVADGSDTCPTGVLFSSNAGTDFDGDGCRDSDEDADDDNDGDPDVTDCNDNNIAIYTGAPESCDLTDSDCDGSLADEFADADGDDTPDCVETDDDADGIADAVDDCPSGDTGWTSDGTTDRDGDGCRDAGAEDPDDDNDGIADGADACPVGNLFTSGPGTDHDGDGCQDASAEDTDDDNDGVTDVSDGCQVGVLFTSAPGTDFDGDGCRDSDEDLDDDDDSDPDTTDCQPLNPAVFNGATELCDLIDSDCDTSLADEFPDTDGDDIPNCVETDDDDDGVADGSDACPQGTTGWTSDGTTDHDGDGCQDADAEDPDDDNDGISDGPDACPLGALFTSGTGTDHDADGCRDSDEDLDDDDDGVLDAAPDACPAGALFTSNASNDHDGDGCRDSDEDGDDDGDGVGDGADACPTGDLFTSDGTTDYDSDGCRDAGTEDPDDDDDGINDGPDDCEKGALFTSDGTTDHDSDGCRDSDEDSDDDNDGILDAAPDACPTGALFTSNGTNDFDGDGCRDTDEDPDDDNDGDLDGPDCNDNNASIYTGAAESCDLIDSDCDLSLVDEFDNNDGDSQPDCVDPDDDNDGDPDTTDCAEFDDGRFTGNTEVLDDAIDQDCNGTDTVSCWQADVDADGYGADFRAEPDGSCDPGELTQGGDCNDTQPLIYPSSLLPLSPGSATDEDACVDTDGDGYCLGGGQDLNDDGDCQDAGEDYDSLTTILGDCDEAVLASVDAESVVDGADDDTDGLIDEGCFGGGEVVVVEYYSLDADTRPDWLEIYNATWFDVSVDGWVVTTDVASTVPTTSGTSIVPGARIVLAAPDVVPQDDEGDLAFTVNTWTGNALNLPDLDGAQTHSIDLSVAGTSVQTIDFTAPSAADWDITVSRGSFVLTEPELAGVLAGVSDPVTTDPTLWCDSPADSWNKGVASPEAVNGTCPP